MERQILTNICNEVYRRFPQVAGAQPRSETRPDGNILLVFSGKAKTADGRSIANTVRVVASPAGKIVKVSTSR